MTTLAAALLIATLYWGPAPCIISATEQALPANVVGTADWDGAGKCVIMVDPRKAHAAGEECMVVTHEYGHLMGAPEGVGVIMSLILQDPVWPCRW